MDLASLITALVAFLTIFGTNVGLFIWVRSEANSDRKHAKAQAENRRAEITALLRAMQDEMKDFHGRLCAIEERRVRIYE